MGDRSVEKGVRKVEMGIGMGKIQEDGNGG